MDVLVQVKTLAQHYLRGLCEFLCSNKTIAMHCSHFKTTWCTFYLHEVINTSVFIDSSRKNKLLSVKNVSYIDFIFYYFSSTKCKGAVLLLKEKRRAFILGEFMTS